MRNGRIGLACLLTLLMSSSQVMAASLGIAPVGLDLPAKQKAAKVSLANKASSTLNIQVRVFKWQQVDGKDELVPTRDVVASPPATSIPPGQTYVIRVARLSSAPVIAEESYRLVIDEVPVAPDERSVNQGVAMVLRTSLPVFFSPADAVPNVQWRVFQQHGKLVAEARNTGQRHVKLIDLAAETNTTTVSLGAGLTGYLLPGSTRRFSAPLPDNLHSDFASGQAITLTGRAGPVEIQERIHVTEQ